MTKGWTYCYRCQRTFYGSHVCPKLGDPRKFKKLRATG